MRLNSSGKVPVLPCWLKTFQAGPECCFQLQNAGLGPPLPPHPLHRGAPPGREIHHWAPSRQRALSWLLGPYVDKQPFILLCLQILPTVGSLTTAIHSTASSPHALGSCERGDGGACPVTTWGIWAPTVLRVLNEIWKLLRNLK